MITEQEVTEQIDVLRKQYGCTDDEAWAKLLGQSGMTAEDMRKQVIDYKAQVMLVNAAASEQGIEVTDAEDRVGYIRSLTGMSELQEIPEEEIRAVLERNMKDGVLRVPKEYGMFMAQV